MREVSGNGAADWLHPVIEHASDIVCVLEREGTVCHVSPAVERILGYKPGELVGTVLPDHVHPEERGRASASLSRALEGPGIHPAVQLRVRAADGSWRHVELAHNNCLDDPRIRGVVTNVRDISDRKGVEDSLKESERRFSTLLSNTPAMVYRCLNEPDWPEEYVSDYALELTGYPAAQFIENPTLFGSLISEEDRQRIWDEVQEAVGRNERFRLHYAIRHKDGGLRFVEELGQGIYDESGGVVALEGLIYDITERVRVEEALKEAETRYRTLVEQIPAVTYIDRADGSDEPLYTSPQIEQMLGYTPREWLERRLWPERLHPDDKERILAADERFEAGEEPFSEEYRLLARDGSVVWVREEAVLVRGEAGEPLYWQGVMYDITERVEAEARLRESEERFRALTQNSSDIITLLEADGTILYESPSIERILGYKPREVAGENAFDYVHPDDLQRVRGAFAQVLANPALRPTIDYRFRHRDGSWRWLESIGTNMLEDPAVGKLVVNSRDVSERKRAEERLRTSEAELRALFAAMNDVVFEIDAQGQVLRIAPTNRLLRYKTREELVGKTLREALPAETAEELLGHIRRSVESRETVKVGYSLPIEGREAYFEGTITPLSQESVVLIGRDITERKALEERLAHQALHDPLTHLPNRVLFTDRLRQALARAKRRRGEVAVLFMDLDNFKVINDSLGHRTGDRLLVAASRRMRGLLRPNDTVGRLGGDEFVFLLEDTDVDGAARVAERILKELGEPFSLGGRQLFVTASVGITVSEGHTKRAADLLRDADVAMYRAKHSGKARYAVFEEAMNTGALERLELEHGLRRAVERNEFVVHYQPKVSLATGKTVGFEALARWEHPERGLLLPKQFIPLAEETGLIVPIGEAVLEEACRQANEWHERRPSDPPTLCVNLSARQFREPGLTKSVARMLDETGLEPSSLFFEVTESTAIRDVLTTATVLEELQDLGVRTILDDFGTGYSSLSYLERLPVDAIKIDHSFVGGLGRYPGAQMLVSAIISLAHALGLEVIAEGVETEAQFERLQGLGCDFAQGHLFSEPLTAEGVADVLGVVHHLDSPGGK